MLNEKAIKEIEAKLSWLAKDYYESSSSEVRCRTNSYCQGIAFVLAEIGYSIDWDGPKATIKKD